MEWGVTGLAVATQGETVSLGLAHYNTSRGRRRALAQAEVIAHALKQPLERLEGDTSTPDDEPQRWSAPSAPARLVPAQRAVLHDLRRRPADPSVGLLQALAARIMWRVRLGADAPYGQLFLAGVLCSRAWPGQPASVSAACRKPRPHPPVDLPTSSGTFRGLAHRDSRLNNNSRGADHSELPGGFRVGVPGGKPQPAARRRSWASAPQCLGIFVAGRSGSFTELLPEPTPAVCVIDLRPGLLVVAVLGSLPALQPPVNLVGLRVPPLTDPVNLEPGSTIGIGSGEAGATAPTTILVSKGMNGD